MDRGTGLGTYTTHHHKSCRAANNVYHGPSVMHTVKNLTLDLDELYYYREVLRDHQNEPIEFERNAFTSCRGKSNPSAF